MNNIKSKFSIKDLENLTGIKAHTIRIWEKRYGILEPKRTDTNIRYYDLSSFQKLLNVSYLNQNGYKISKIATLNDDGINQLVKEVVSFSDTESAILNDLKLSMVNFDQRLFYSTYKKALQEKSFSEVFYEIFIPLLNEIGLLWQTNTITPAHEHFITTLMKQKITLNTEKLQSQGINDSKKTFVLYLPDNEVHELGIMFINYEILNKGYQSIFLGQSVPLESLTDLEQFYDEIIYISYFTVKPEKDDIEAYISDFDNLLLKGKNTKLWILGRMLEVLDEKHLPKSVQAFKSIKALTEKIAQLNE